MTSCHLEAQSEPCTTSTRHPSLTYTQRKLEMLCKSLSKGLVLCAEYVVLSMMPYVLKSMHGL